jgi:hypothetical protein
VVWAEKMGERVTTDPAKSRSTSFRALHRGIEGLVLARPVAATKLVLVARVA